MSGGLSLRAKMDRRLREDEKTGKVILKRKSFTFSSTSNVYKQKSVLVSLPRLKFMEDKE